MLPNETVRTPGRAGSYWNSERPKAAGYAKALLRLRLKMGESAIFRCEITTWHAGCTACETMSYGGGKDWGSAELFSSFI